MTDPAVVPSPEPDPKPAPKPDKPGDAEPFKTYATEADYEAHKKKMTEADRKRADRAEAELDALRKKNESEAEKVERERQERMDAELAERQAKLEKAADLRAVLMARGLDKDKAKNLAELAGGEWADTDEAIATLEGRYGLMLQGEGHNKIGGGGGRNAPSEPEDFSPDAVAKKLESMTPRQKAEYLAKNREKIHEARYAHLGITPSIAPGQGISYRPADK